MKIQVNSRLDEPYVLALRQFSGQGARLIQSGLDHLPNTEFQRELAKQKEAYGPIEDNNQDHPDTQAVREEFSQ